MTQERLTAWQLFYIASGTMGCINFYLMMDQLIDMSSTSAYMVLLAIGAVIGLLCMPMPSLLTREEGKDFTASHMAAFGTFFGVFILILFLASLILAGGMMLNEMMQILDRYQTPNLEYYWIAVPLMLVCAVVAGKGGVRVLAGLFFIVLCLRIFETGLLVLGVTSSFELRSILPLWSGLPERPGAAIARGSALFSGIEMLVFLRLYTAGLKARSVRGAIWSAVGAHCAFLIIGSWLMLGICGFDMIRLVDLTTIDFYRVISFQFFEQLDEVGISIQLFWTLSTLAFVLWINATMLRKAVFRRWPEAMHYGTAALLMLAVAAGLWEFRLNQLLQKWQPIVLLVMLCVYIPIYGLLLARARKSGQRVPTVGGESS
ncbi:GerAB/ArcD/ProY family transporter [Paenibacillus montanisoli]|uniref:Uncharacterized protein n=1 Tax=Paenibacillus montanisoli TaxID=2081970 RepID=A0A328TRT1_9BACL|nr:GerAB/ArcD/ProY family transporter [Paenibacillus montanisoli]RAP73279.1 hypothetical protein DL346_27840 [Paenibacillus montanisoli]